VANIFSFMVFIGVVLQLSAWVTGPAKTMIAVAKAGILPASFGFHKENKYGVCKNIVLTQSVIISLFALLYGFMEDVNGVFLTLTNATTILYCIVYVLIAIALIKLRKKMPDAPRAYRIGRKGNGLAWIMSIVVILSILISVAATFVTSSFMDSVIVFVIAVILFIMPLLIYKKPNSEKSEAQNKGVSMINEDYKA
jgi:amino acid transporter